eukprot:CAMPEP_0202694242 /NCGR_PEP_ID=MMETSP1385-20130828/8154_1 /ASSEMBLY_ACC=CAM_ASM_000861 /TAXON_ID=933848 /ORGANISM="Elphidium margaritaceum" /LENGTH=313 /DNA_ID=CAMNT_0049350055 /DNA_START=27 /DNA_END=965 /DNA_ORIENTATION=+
MANATSTVFVVILSIYLVAVLLLICFVSYTTITAKESSSDGNLSKFKICKFDGLNVLIQMVLWSSLCSYIGFIVIWASSGNATEVICDTFYTLAFISIFTFFWSTFLFWLFRLFYTFDGTNLSMSVRLKNVFLAIIVTTYIFLIIGVFAFVLPKIEADYALDEDDNEILEEKQCYSHGSVPVFIVVAILVLSILFWNITFCTMYIVKHRQSNKRGVKLLVNDGSSEKQAGQTDTTADIETGQVAESKAAPATDEKLKYDIEKQVLITVIMISSSFISWALILQPSTALEIIGFADWFTNALCIVLMLPAYDHW